MFVGLFLLLCFLPREASLAFVVKLVWWCWILLAFACLKRFWFLRQIWIRSLLCRVNLGCRFFSFITLSISCHSLLTCRVSAKKSADNLMGIPLYVIFCFSLAAFHISSLNFYFWLHWVFVAVHGLSLVAASGGYSLLWCAGFSLWWLLLLQSTGSRWWVSVVVAHGPSSCGSWALERRLSSCGTWA